MTYKNKARAIGKRATIQTTLPDGLTIEVDVLDYKFSYGNDRWLVRPVAGTGQAWVQKIKT
jgi:hypothetical protein